MCGARKEGDGKGETCDFTGAVGEDARLWEEDIWADRMHPGGREALGQNTKSSAAVNLKERQGSRWGGRVAGEGNGGGDAGEREKPCHVALCRSRVVLRILC